VARVIDYPLVLETLTRAGFVSLYHNSGAFGFPREVSTQSVGWIGPKDATLKPAALPLTRRVPPPCPITLAALAGRVWQGHLRGPVWLMPRNHWAFELNFGNSEWMPALLERAGIDPQQLAGRNDGSAVEFSDSEEPLLRPALAVLLERLWGSDFALAWPGRPCLCTVHHHTQLWWTTTDASLIDALDALVPPADGSEDAD
jgi:hypothetical protein